MIREALLRFGKTIKNKQIYIDDNLDSKSLFEFAFTKLLELFRGLRVVFKGRLIFLGRSVRIKYAHKIKFGTGVSIGDYCMLSGFGKEGLIIGNGVSIGNYCSIIVSTNYKELGEYIKIEDGVGIGDYSRIGGSGGIIIGRNTIIANYFSAHPENHIFSSIDIPIKYQGTNRQKIVIGEDCWISAKVTILAGVTIGNHCVIGAGSVVTKSVPDYSIVVGVPARVIKSRLTEQ